MPQTPLIKAHTLRRVGTVCLAFGAAGLLFTVIIVGLLIAGATESPGFSMVVWTIQAAVNVASGWNLRRLAASSAADPVPPDRG